MLAGFTVFVYLLYALANFDMSDDRNKAMTAVFIGYSIMIMFISAMLIFATLKENTSFLLAWLIVIATAAALSLTIDVIFKMGRVGIALIPVDVLLQLYCLLVVHSYRVQILKKNVESTILGNPDQHPTNEFENKVYTKNETKDRETSQ